MGKELFELLRYCFQAGYTLPQYCIDNNIKQPIFIMEKNADWFLKEVHVQFVYDNRLAVPQFCFIDDDKSETFIYINKEAMFLAPGQIHVKALSEVNLKSFDAVILLTRKNVDLSGTKIITLAELEGFFIPRTYIEMPILNYLQHHPKVKFFMTNFPNIYRYKGASEVHAKLWDMDVKALKDALKKNNTVAPWDKFGYTSEQIEELIEPAKVVKHPDGTTTLLEDGYPLRGIQNGKRTTAYQPEKFLNKIYLFGTCHQYGTNAPFDKTIESYLQKLLNDNNLPYRVENEGQAYFGRIQDVYYNLYNLNPAPNDIIIFFFWYMWTKNDIIPFCDVSDALDPPVDYREVYCIKGHLNELGYKALAEKYFKFLTENNFFRDKEFNYPLPPPPRITATVSPLGQNRAA